MKAYKIEVLILDFDNLGADGIKEEIENARYSNHCIAPKIKQCEERDIGTWSDDHPLNNRLTEGAEYYRLFNERATPERKGQTT